MWKRAGRLPELWFTGAMIIIVALISIWFDLPFNLPAGDRAPAVGVQYIYPLAGAGLWALLAFVGIGRRMPSTFFVALPCYAIVLVCHFNLKLWVPHINPTLWDQFYWGIDQKLQPVVAACTTIRHWFAPLFPIASNSYMVAFITMFYLSFSLHALRTPDAFRALFLAALFFQGAGAIAYLVAPALGPFIYEQGVSPIQTHSQMLMLQDYRDHLAGGRAWLDQFGGTNITVGLAAMPSLHAGGSFLFLLMAWHYVRVLVPLYATLFFFIATAAIANRWHYVIDVPAGMALAWVCVFAARKLVHGSAVQAEASAAQDLVPAAA